MLVTYIVVCKYWCVQVTYIRLYDGVLSRNGFRNILVEQGHKVWWIFGSTRGEIESPDLEVEGWVKSQEVLEHTLSASVWHGDGLFALDMSSNLTHCSEYTTLLRMHPLDCSVVK